jgi:hypothetical protein
MGFNYEQYVINSDDNYSNILGIGSGKVKKALGIGDGKVLGLNIGSGSVKTKLGIGSGTLKSKLGIGDGKIFGKVVNPTKNAQFEANKYVTSGQAEIDRKQAEEDAKKETEKETEVGSDVKKDGALSSTTGTAPKSNTNMYIGIGVGVLVLGVIGFLVMRNK